MTFHAGVTNAVVDADTDFHSEFHFGVSRKIESSDEQYYMFGKD